MAIPLYILNAIRWDSPDYESANSELGCEKRDVDLKTETFRKSFNLGFSTDPRSPDLPLMLGKKRQTRRREILREVAAWVLVSCGIFLRRTKQGSLH